MSQRFGGVVFATGTKQCLVWGLSTHGHLHFFCFPRRLITIMSRGGFRGRGGFGGGGGGGRMDIPAGLTFAEFSSMPRHGTPLYPVRFPTLSHGQHGMPSC